MRRTLGKTKKKRRMQIYNKNQTPKKNKKETFLQKKKIS